ncbi:MAG: hypothetical protein J3Q66DRAFT_333472 [Benniella sp.]|nr:MAG: hypothetical protein J3Q66DRAFT_333472 [Benniella sp.]
MTTHNTFLLMFCLLLLLLLLNGPLEHIGAQSFCHRYRGKNGGCRLNNSDISSSCKLLLRGSTVIDSKRPGVVSVGRASNSIQPVVIDRKF